MRKKSGFYTKTDGFVIPKKDGFAATLATATSPWVFTRSGSTGRRLNRRQSTRGRTAPDGETSAAAAGPQPNRTPPHRSTVRFCTKPDGFYAKKNGGGGTINGGFSGTASEKLSFTGGATGSAGAAGSAGGRAAVGEKIDAEKRWIYTASDGFVIILKKDGLHSQPRPRK